MQTGTKIALEHSKLTEKIIGVFYDVYNHFGPGFLESVYQRSIDPAHEAQVIHYLRSTHLEVGLLFNFGAKAEFKRFYLANSNKQIRGISEISGKVL